MRTIICLLLVLSSAGCQLPKCTKEGVVKTVGQCAYSKIGDYGSSECVALTEDGVKVSRESPYVVGETVCEAWGR